MNKSSEKFNIDSYIKTGFDLVIELDDEVEYLIDMEAVTAVKNDKKIVVLKRLVDGEKIIIPTSKVINNLQKNELTDYLEIK